MYQIVVYGSPFYLDELKEELRDTVNFVNGDEINHSYPILCLYYGQSKKDQVIDEQLSSILDGLVSEQCILPIVKDLASFNSIIPSSLKAINAFKLQDRTSIVSLKNRILEFFGLINSTRKVFISYKRDDTETLAIQLFDALIKRGYFPFLDSYSIVSGVPFQKYLRHELSDSEIMLFLNSPNFDKSEYTMEELNIASCMRVGIVQVRFVDCAIKGEADLSKVVEMDLCKNKSESYTQADIDKILDAIDDYRAQSFEQKKKFLIQEIRSKYSKDELIYINENILLRKSNNWALYPKTYMPNSVDMQIVDSSDISGYKCTGKIIVYNGVYCRNDLKEHYEWLNTKCENIKILNISDI